VFVPLLWQWRKHPTIFFVSGVDKARIGWNEKEGVAYHKFFKTIEDADQRQKFRETYNLIFKTTKGA